ncbi:ATPase [Pseudoduganella buxea]|uniref:ATPase n=1 Tax=Pseudoduganella buxea TaxID=1949069 RepID=A0A6I3T354_9BURK|nr:ATPase [Pseudoduganella buxea]MTV54892.1 ATPase [Pseudoduganella buxea]GGB99981.1 hypothetical protein GCM10011572_22420 [Pseudoduganella buxea]
MHAYCQELADVVDIDAARRCFACEEPPLPRYQFHCDDPHCAPLRVRITGVNYRVFASESAKYVAPHFRALDPHHPDCQWMLDSDPDAPRPGETAEEARQRQLRRKLHDMVTVFDPTVRRDEAPTARPADTAPGDVGYPAGGAVPVRGPAAGGDGPDTRTSQLTRLVETYVEARTTLPRETFRELTIRVVGEGTMLLDDYFRHLAGAGLDTANRVIYGGARLTNRYGKGFKLKFFDKVAGTDVFLYVSPARMAAYRFRKLLELALARADDVRYFKVYALGRLVPGKAPRHTDFIVDDLRHLVLVLGPEKADAAAAPDLPDAAGDAAAPVL